MITQPPFNYPKAPDDQLDDFYCHCVSEHGSERRTTVQ
jgi:hypothetical protein